MIKIESVVCFPPKKKKKKGCVCSFELGLTSWAHVFPFGLAHKTDQKLVAPLYLSVGPISTMTQNLS